MYKVSYIFKKREANEDSSDRMKKLWSIGYVVARKIWIHILHLLEFWCHQM